MDMYVHWHVINKGGNMKKLKEKELKQINGGGMTASFLTAIVRAATGLLDLGRSLGSAIRRIQSGTVCSL